MPLFFYIKQSTSAEYYVLLFSESSDIMNTCPAEAIPYTIRPGDTLWHIAQKFNTDIDSIRYYNQSTDLSVIYIGQTICVPAAQYISESELDLNNLIRMLWEQHVYWTRVFIISAVFSLPDVNLVTDRLLRNPKDFEAALRPPYGDVIASKFSDLLTSHLTIAAELVMDAKAGDSAAAADAEKRWYQNADQIASFLSSINPYWPALEWQRLLYDHLAMTKNEAINFLQHNYAGSISTFENIEKKALDMADLMTSGIVNQFPNRYAVKKHEV